MFSPQHASQIGWHDVLPPREFLTGGSPLIAAEGVPTCLVCGSGQYDQVALGFDYELRTCRNPWRFVQCRSCGHVWLHPRPTLSALRTIYPPTYYAYNYTEQINPIAVQGKAWLDRWKMRSIIRWCPKPLRGYLDVGCGDGHLLRTVEAWEVPRDRLLGLDIDAQVVATLRQGGYRAICGRVEACDEVAKQSLSLVTMFHVLEHVADPSAVVRRIAEWLTTDGVLAVETPNIESLDARLFRRGYWGGYHIPRHWHLFRPSTLAKLLTDGGFRVVSTEFQTGHSFWMFSFHHGLRYGRHTRPRLATWFDPLRGLPLLVLFTGFDKIRAALGFKTSAMLMIARKSS